jgi:membrane-bound lytic murein transglycosylase D
MQSKPFVIVLFAAMLFSGGCFLTGSRWSAAGEEARVTPQPGDELYHRYPQILQLEQKLDRASAHFYFGERDLSLAAANEILEDIAELGASSRDPLLCDRLDYLENRARCLLQRLSDDELVQETEPYMVSFIDSLARTTVVEEEIEVEYNGKTQHWIDYFRGSGRKHFSRWLDRTGELRDVIEPILIDVGIPRDLLYLAVIESGLNMGARSYMKAIGPWQFMAGTARLFGLRINWWLDERKDIVAATYAAANYLKYLHDLFDSWPLALAAYNSGEHRVAYAITRQRTTDYWRLQLPTQTMWFVPKFMAALAIGRNPEAYGFQRPLDDPLEFDIIEVDRPTELRAIASAADCSLDEIKKLNPHFKKWCTPPDMIVEVKVPKGRAGQCRDSLAGMKQRKLQSFVQHKVKKGETLSHIASEYEISLKELRNFNELGRSQMIKAGNILLIPVQDTERSARIASRPSYRNPERPSIPVSLPLLSASDGGKRVRHVVKKDDTLVRIAERFHTSLAQLREWNALTYDSVIRPGDTLWIHINDPAGRKESAARAVPDRAEATSLADAAGTAADPPPVSEPEWITHVVKKGETLSSIGRLYKVRLADILTWNQKANRNRLYPGEQLKIRRSAG